jgi:hypothetical protein
LLSYRTCERWFLHYVEARLEIMGLGSPQRLSLGVPSKTEHPTHGARELGGRTGSWVVDRGLKIINAKILGMALFV